MKLSRLSGRKTCDYVLRKGRIWKGKTLIIRWLPGSPRVKGGDPKPPGLYVGTFASTRLHKSAVTRNRMRRRVREGLRTVVKEESKIPSAQLLLSPRPASLNAPFEDIQNDIRTFLSTLSSWPKKSDPRAS